MLSKLMYFLDHERAFVNPNVKILTEELKLHFLRSKKLVLIEPVGGGTLGVTFNLIIDGKKRFVKTHMPGEECKQNIIKEIKLMTSLYEELNIQRVDLYNESAVQIYFLMDELKYPDKDTDIADIQELIFDYGEKLKKLKDIDFILPQYTFTNLFELGQTALQELVEKQFISQEIHKQVLSYFYFLKPRIPYLSPVLCHGDLGSKNIMFKDGKSFVIDWEDAFWGVKDYDYLYWLTFFNHRKYYSLNPLSEKAEDKKRQIAILLLIITLKSYLSYLMNTHLNNSLSFDQRIQEILLLAD